MKVLMISVNRLALFPTVPLGTGLAAASVRNAGHTVQLLDLWWERDYKKAINEKIKSFKPDILGISIRNSGEFLTKDNPKSYIGYIKEIVSIARQYSFVMEVIMGGFGFSCAPEAFLQYCNAEIGIIGEAEISFPLLLQKKEENLPLNDVPNIIIRKNDYFEYGPYHRLEDMNLVNTPCWDLYEKRYFKLKTFVPVMNIQTKRGCTFRCTYCDVPYIDTRHNRLRPIGKVIEELEMIKKEISPKWIFIADNIFNNPTEHAVAICNEMFKRNILIPWVAFAVPHLGDREQYKIYKKAKCNMLCFEILSASNTMLENWGKGYTNNDIIRAARWCNEAGVMVLFLVQFGGPGETIETVCESVDVLEKLKTALVKIQVPYLTIPYHEVKKLTGTIESPHRTRFLSESLEGAEINQEMQEVIDNYINNNHNVLLEENELNEILEGRMKIK